MPPPRNRPLSSPSRPPYRDSDYQTWNERPWPQNQRRQIAPDIIPLPDISPSPFQPIDPRPGFNYVDAPVRTAEGDCGTWLNALGCNFWFDDPVIRDDTGDFVDWELRSGVFDWGVNETEAWACYQGGNRVYCVSWRNEPPPPVPTLRRMPPLPNWQPNNTGEGWIPRCQYLVLIGTGFQFGSSEDSGPARNPDYEAWEQLGWNPGKYTGFVIPAYGPIVGLQYGGGEQGHYSLHCGGVGRPIVAGESAGINWSTPIFGHRSGNDRVVDTRGWSVWTGLWTFGDFWALPPGAHYGVNAILQTDPDQPTAPTYALFGPPGYKILHIIPAHRVGGVQPPFGRNPGRPIVLGSPCGLIPDPPPPPPPPRTEDDMACCNCSEIEAIIRRRLRPIFDFLQILENGQMRAPINPESQVKNRRNGLYTQPLSECGTYKPNNLTELLATLLAVDYHRSGWHELPAELPKTLLSYTDNEALEKIPNSMKLWEWYIKQFDGLVGNFPIKIQIKDTDPAQEGDQTQEIELSNLSEALAEMYGLQQTAAINGDLAINFLMRLAAEVVATKNSSLITQDHAKAISSYLGYKGNPINREIDYAFDPTRPDSLPDMLKEKKGQIIGWKNDDKDSVADYLQKLMFSAGIIKAVFLKTRSRFDELQEQIEAIAEPGADDMEDWRKFVQEMNNLRSQFNFFGENPYPNSRVKNRSADRTDPLNNRTDDGLPRPPRDNRRGNQGGGSSSNNPGGR